MVEPVHGLSWAIKASFLSYARRLPDCQIYVREGAGYPDGRFHFQPAPASEYDPTTEQGTLRFAGDVRVVGHHGMLHVMIQDPWLEIDGRRGTLTVVDPDYYPDRSRRMALVQLSMAAPTEVAGHREWKRISTALRPEATALFGNTYAPGEAFDPVDVTVTVAGPDSPGPRVEVAVGIGYRRMSAQSAAGPSSLEIVEPNDPSPTSTRSRRRPFRRPVQIGHTLDRPGLRAGDNRDRRI